jgi:glycosyltransferase involved in cell wall biosynthesis
MHVLITADTLGGVWTYARELVTGLAQRGVRVTLVSFGEIPAPEDSEWVHALPTVDFRPTGFRLEWMQDSEADLEASAEYLANLVDEVKPELLHLNQYFYGSLPGPLPRLMVAHSDVISWWHAVHGEPPPETRWMNWYREIVSRGLSAAQAVVAPTRWMLERIAEHYVRPANARVIANGRSQLGFNPHVSKQEYVVSVGRLWDSAKQVTLLAQQKMPLTTYIVGSLVHPDTAFRAGLQVPAAGGGNLQFKGPQKPAQLRQLYSRASMYAATSRYEPFGLAPLEAALSRCALVANDIPTFHEIWGDNACYFRRNDAESLRQQIERLHGNPDLRQKYANLAYHHALAHYTTDRMVEAYLELYQTLVPAHSLAA